MLVKGATCDFVSSHGIIELGQQAIIGIKVEIWSVQAIIGIKVELWSVKSCFIDFGTISHICSADDIDP